MQRFLREAGRNWAWLVVAGSLVAVGFAVHSPYVAYIGYAFGLLLVLSHTLTRLWLEGVEVTREVTPDTVQMGETVSVRIRVGKKAGLPAPWLYVADWFPRDFPLEGTAECIGGLWVGRPWELAYTLTCPRRGYHPLGPLWLETVDVFGLQRRFKTDTQRDYVSVLPNVVYLETTRYLTRRPQGPVKITHRIYDDPTRIANVREYVPGDPIKAIHWKVSAHMGRLHVKVYEPAVVSGGTVVLNLREDDFKPERKEERIELAVTTAASLAYLLHACGEQVGLVTNAADAAERARFVMPTVLSWSREDIEQDLQREEENTRLSPLCVPTLRTRDQAQKILANLARVVPSHGLPAHTMLLHALPQLPRNAALLLVVPQVDGALATVLMGLKERGLPITVFVIADQAAYQEAQHYLIAHNIEVIHIEHERDLHEIHVGKSRR
jgi:hypothetical protein